jgi:hypothetical protein
MPLKHFSKHADVYIVVIRRHLIEQIDLLREHMEQTAPDPEFIERHALAIMDLARSMPVPPKPAPKRMLKVFTQLHENSA